MKAVPKIDVAMPRKDVTTFSNEEEPEMELMETEESEMEVKRELWDRKLR